MTGYRFTAVCDRGHPVTMRVEEREPYDPSPPAHFVDGEGMVHEVYPMRVFPPATGCETCHELNRGKDEPAPLTWWQRRRFRKQLDPRNF